MIESSVESSTDSMDSMNTPYDKVIETYPMSQQDRELSITFAAYQKQVIRFASYCLGNVEHSEDIAQEVFLRLSDNPSSWKKALNKKAYLYGITKNICRHYIKKIKREREKVDHSKRSYTGISEPKEIDSDALLLNKALNTLPQKYREPLLLSSFEHYSYEEVAKCLNIRIGTVKSRINQAKVMLLKTINKWRSS